MCSPFMKMNSGIDLWLFGTLVVTKFDQLIDNELRKKKRKENRYFVINLKKPIS